MVMKGKDKLLCGIKQLQQLPEILATALIQTYSEPCQTSRMKRFVTTVNG